ncbi:hypothetical protein B5M47_01750 [candidate division CPR3 bacterium 4484_211]|uniref:Glycosyltransferase 2-like domain-containing protein n=1 Tax=candidate division CPR3 bacterium 4484_211 TaxID=1968527 RepID=A0A1W9NYF6_UNCC3|nr:MAG: hypothetical protein B5M47_01750 [candidate division CPR3 bacterium 4484_211]
MLSVIIVNYNTKKLIKRCLTSVYRWLKDPLEVIIVDNNSTDGSRLMIKKDFPQAKLISLGKNIGFGGANNLGLRSAQGDLFLLLNSDAYLISSPSAIVNFIKKTDADLVSPRLIKANGTTQKYICGNFYNLFSPIKKLLPGTKPWNSAKPIKVDWVSAAALFLTRKAYLKTGGFDETYFMYFEDQDLCYRAQKAGLNIYYYPKYAICHDEGGSSKGNKKKIKKYYYQSLIKFFQKTRPHWEELVVSLSLKFLRVK